MNRSTRAPWQSIALAAAGFLAYLAAAVWLLSGCGVDVAPVAPDRDSGPAWYGGGVPPAEAPATFPLVSVPFLPFNPCDVAICQAPEFDRGEVSLPESQVEFEAEQEALREKHP